MPDRPPGLRHPQTPPQPLRLSFDEVQVDAPPWAEGSPPARYLSFLAPFPVAHPWKLPLLAGCGRGGLQHDLRHTPVLSAIRRTLGRTPERFHERNDGLWLFALGSLIDQDARVAELAGAVLVDGYQTLGEINDACYWARLRPRVYPPGIDVAVARAKVRVQVCQLDLDTLTDFLHEVPGLTYVPDVYHEDPWVGEARYRHLRDLEGTLCEHWNPDAVLGCGAEEDEPAPATPVVPELAGPSEAVIVSLDRLLRALLLCVPAEVWHHPFALDRTIAYTWDGDLSGTCLHDAQPFHAWAEEDTSASESRIKDVRRFHLEAGADVLALERRWREEPALLAALEAMNPRRVAWQGFPARVPAGVLFPVLAALGACGIRQSGSAGGFAGGVGRWGVRVPPVFDAAAFSREVVAILAARAGGDPDRMGRSQDCYAAAHRAAEGLWPTLV